MSKLISVGCSSVIHFWDTWADFLGRHFDTFENLGIPGTDNPTISRVVTAFAEPGDTVVVMWTGYQRHCFDISRKDTYSWSHKHCGMQNITNKNYFTSVFNPYERLLTTLDYMKLVILDSQVRNYKVHHFCAFPMLAGELDTPLSNDMLDLVKENQFYLDLITTPAFNSFAQGKKLIPGDDHPTPTTHYEFYEQVVCPTLKIQPLVKREDAELITDKFLNRRDV